MGGDERVDQPQAADALEAYVTRLLSDRASEIPMGLDREELQAYLLAAALAGQRAGAADLPADARARLTSLLDDALAKRGQAHLPEGTRPRRMSRRQGFTAAAGLAAGVLVGVGVDRGVRGLSSPSTTHQELVGPNGQWYNVAAETALPVGAVRRFVAGAVDGYLINEHGRLWALSAICTHMGCHINWAASHTRFECLCHGATFDRYGRPGVGLTLATLPSIHVRVQSGRIYVWGTQASQWG